MNVPTESNSIPKPCPMQPIIVPTSAAARTGLRPAESDSAPIIGAQKNTSTGYAASAIP